MSRASRVILVEGVSDRDALLTLAERLGRDLAAEGVDVIAMGGATNIRRYVREYGPEGLGLRIGGLCDENEEPIFRRALEQAGFGSELTRPDLERLGFFVCERDLEDELLRALGPAGTERVFAEQGDLADFRVFQNQPYQRTRTIEQQLHRFLGSVGGRKQRYARAFVGALALEAIPRPLRRVLE